MRVFRQFDYFRKSTSPEQIKPTCVGGLISLACVASIAALLYSELLILWEPEYKKNTTVSTDPHRHTHIILNLDIDFPNVPCFLLEMSVTTPSTPWMTRTSMRTSNSNTLINKKTS